MTVITIVADFQPGYGPHEATQSALERSANQQELAADISWLPTSELDTAEGKSQVHRSNGVLIGPGSPYQNMPAVLEVIRYARENRIPLLGTCGGFQHVIIEYARHVLVISDAHHEEYDPYASKLVISKLTCSLAGREMLLRIKPGTLAASIYQSKTAEEPYYCNFGIAPEYVSVLESGDLINSASDDEGEMRIVELPTSIHPFFLATLFVPQMNSTRQTPHPIIEAFVRACAQSNR